MSLRDQIQDLRAVWLWGSRRIAKELGCSRRYVREVLGPRAGECRLETEHSDAIVRNAKRLLSDQWKYIAVAHECGISESAVKAYAAGRRRRDVAA